MRRDDEAGLPYDRDEWIPGGGVSSEEYEPLRKERLDLLLPHDPETGAVTPAAFQVYLGAMMDMIARAQLPLALMTISVDDTPALNFFGVEGTSLIGRAVVRCIRQETRVHDVVGCTAEKDVNGLPCFLIVCPLLSEDHAANLAERLRMTMTAYAADPDRPWLTLSIGVAGMALDAMESESLLARANAALRYARRMGGGCVWRHSDTLRHIIEADS
jgi:GGDEF domain-containing protein